MKSKFSRSIRFHSWTSSNWTQKKVTETKDQKILDRTLKMAFFTHDILGLQQSLCNINSSFGIFISKYQRKKLLKCTTAIAESVKQGDFGDLFLAAIFARKHDFWSKPTIPEKFDIFWESDEQKFWQLCVTVFIHERNSFPWSVIFFALNFI